VKPERIRIPNLRILLSAPAAPQVQRAALWDD